MTGELLPPPSTRATKLALIDFIKLTDRYELSVSAYGENQPDWFLGPLIMEDYVAGISSCYQTINDTLREVGGLAMDLPTESGVTRLVLGEWQGYQPLYPTHHLWLPLHKQGAVYLQPEALDDMRQIVLNDSPT